ncbi:Phage holin, LL-H family, partial [Dysosmobacter welbionis]
KNLFSLPEHGELFRASDSVRLLCPPEAVRSQDLYGFQRQLRPAVQKAGPVLRQLCRQGLGQSGCQHTVIRGLEKSLLPVGQHRRLAGSVHLRRDGKGFFLHLCPQRLQAVQGCQVRQNHLHRRTFPRFINRPRRMVPTRGIAVQILNADHQIQHRYDQCSAPRQLSQP